jgi:hypothetical protein
MSREFEILTCWGRKEKEKKKIAELRKPVTMAVSHFE